MPRPPTRLPLRMVLAFSEWWWNSIRECSVARQAKARAEERFPGQRTSLSFSPNSNGSTSGWNVLRESATGNWPSAWRSAVGPSNGWTGRGALKLQPLQGAWPVGSLTQYQQGQRPGGSSSGGPCCPKGLSGGLRPANASKLGRAGQGRRERTGRPPAPIPEQTEQCRMIAEEAAGLRHVPKMMTFSPTSMRKVLTAEPGGEPS